MAKKKEVVWAPQKGSQELFLSCPLFEVLLAGNRGGGKTDALVMDFAQFVGKGFGEAWRGTLFRQTYDQLRDVIAKTKRWYPKIWELGKEVNYNRNEHFWEWSTGEILYLRQYERDDDYDKYHGHEYPWIGWEELTTWASDIGYRRMMSLCRSTVEGMPRHYRATTNPYGPGLTWVKDRFKLPSHFNKVIEGELDVDLGKKLPPRVAIESLLQENLILLKAEPDYDVKIAQAARNEAEKDAWLNNNWDVAAGSMFHDVWDNRYNLVQPFEIPSSWRVDRSFDWGSSKPFSVGWWAQSDGTDYLGADGRWHATVRGDLFRIHEWYGWTGKADTGKRMLATDVARGIRLREMNTPVLRPLKVRPGPADSSIYTSEDGPTIADKMKKAIRLDDGRKVPGVKWKPADKSAGSRKNGWETMRDMMKAAHPNKSGNPREEPGLFVFSTCYDGFLRTVLVLPRDEKDPDDCNTKAEDHAADEARYRVRAKIGRVRQGQHRGASY